MESSQVLLLAVSVALNIVVIKFKLDRGRTTDAVVDGLIFIVLMWLFSRSTDGLSIATTASSIVSVYLFFSPPKSIEDIIKYFKG